MKAIRIHQHGGPEVLTYEDIEEPQPGRAEVLVRIRAIGVNFTDAYIRRGNFSPTAFPFTPGKEAAGEVIAVGEDVAKFRIGDRVGFVETLGAYAERCVVPEHFLVHLPETVGFHEAAACLLRGLTAQFLLRRTFQVQPGQTILVHAAAGGVGSILTQWAKHLGAIVIGTVGSHKNEEIARTNGCDLIVNYNEENFVERVKQFTEGRGCDVVYDSVGKATFPGSLDCLRPFGHFVSYGLSSGPIPPFDIMLLLEKGSLYATWPGLTAYLEKRSDVIAMSDELFEAIANEWVRIPAPRILALKDADQAHKRLEERNVGGITILVP